MRKITVLLLMLIPALAVLAGGGPSKPAYSIKVKVSGVKDTACYLAFYYGDKQYLKDTAYADKNGVMVFDGAEKLPTGIYMVVLPGRKYFELIVHKEQYFSLETDTLDYIKNMKITGSDENRLFYDYLRFIDKRGMMVGAIRDSLAALEKHPKEEARLNERIRVIDQEVADYKKDFIANNPQTFVAKVFKAMTDVEVPSPLLPDGKVDSLFRYNYFKAHFFDNIDFTEDGLLRTPVYHNKLKSFMKNMVIQIPDSINKEADIVIEKARANKELFKYTVIYIMNTYETSTTMGMDAVFVHMADKYYATGDAHWVDPDIKEKILEKSATLKPILIGKQAPNLVMYDTLGRAKELHKTNSKYTIIYFYDIDCGHCKKVTPKLNEIYKKYAAVGFKVYGVYTQGNFDGWKAYIRDNHLDWTNVIDLHNNSNFRKTYDIISTPVIYILDKDKKIVAKKVDVEQLDEFLEYLINRKDNG